jgi:hypothetical protein
MHAYIHPALPLYPVQQDLALFPCAGTMRLCDSCEHPHGLQFILLYRLVLLGGAPHQTHLLTASSPHVESCRQLAKTFLCFDPKERLWTRRRQTNEMSENFARVLSGLSILAWLIRIALIALHRPA